MNTPQRIFADPSEKRVLAALLPHLKWRHHGNGLLQAYIHPHLRVHIWDAELRVYPDGETHDHRRPITSDVLVGEIKEARYASSPTGLSYQGYHCRGASDGTLEATDKIALVERTRMLWKEGAVYHVPAYEIHSAESDWAVTLVRLGDPGDKWARLFYRGDGVPRQAFDHNQTDPAPFIEKAVRALGGAI